MCKTNTRKRVALLVAVLLAVAIFAAPAEASGVPSKIIVFTDKKVYQAWWVDSPQSGGGVDFVNYDPDFGDVYVYATVLDDDGKIMKGRTITGNLYDTVEYDHEQKANPNVHHANLADPNLYDRSLIFNDTGTFGDGVAGDGIYTAKTTLSSSSFGLAAGNARNENHIKLRAYANDTAGGLSGNTEALISYLLCMNGFSGSMGSTHAKWTPGGMDNCAVCHIGYEHLYENISGTFAASQVDIHALKWNPADVTPIDTCGKGFEAWVWNRSGPWDAGGASCTENWETQVPGSKYCFRCHIEGSALYDYDSSQSSGATTRNNLSDKPRCNNANCHSTTDIEGVAVIPWTQAGAVSGAGQSNSNIWKQKSHNHTTTSTANVSCALCHLTQHGFSRPSNSTTNVTQICLTCHNRSDGWINVSKNVSHTSTGECKNCHLDNNQLDSHLVPTGVFGGKWCMDCHKILGKSPIDMDENVTNVSNTNYIHYALNNKSAGTTNSSRICWGCHTNDSVVVNGIVNSTKLPESTHPDKYNQPRNCTSCHNSTASTNFSAPQTYRHTWYAANMKTTAVTYCTNCHGQSEMALSYNQSATTPSTDNESASHYGKVRTDLEEKIGSREYCGYCHQNETTVMGPFANPDNEVRSDHASQATTPGCGNNTCHKPGRMHENTLIVPAFTEANIGTTCQACHSSGSYSSHNSTVTCWDCHMGNVSSTSATWIHPIQFIQYNGNFTGAKLTGTTCYDCHKSTSVDSTITNLSGKSPPKVYNQAHSSDPNNGTKWGDYWKYTPTTYEFASFEILGGNGSIDPLHPFANIQVPSNDYMQLNETQTGRMYDVTLPAPSNDRDFTSIPSGNWTSSTATGGVTGTVSASYDSTTGNPAGSLKGSLTTSSTTGQHFGYIWWNYSFNYNPNSSQYKYTNASVDYSVTVASATYAQNVYLNIVKPSGAVVTLASSGPITANTGWLTLSNYSFASALNENGSITPYKLQLYAVLSGPKTSQVFTVNYDNVNLRIKEKVWNRYDIAINTTGVPINGSSKLGMSYQVHRENTSLMIYNKTSFAYELLDTLDKGVFFDYTKNISTHHINSTNGVTGNVSVKFADDDQSDTDATTDAMHIRYLYIYTDRGLQYPCEQCHSPNKHYIFPTIGSPDKFKANNAYDQAISSTSTWCQQCHWQGAANYSKMIQEFNVTRNPPENIPPEITGNATYGNYTKYGGKSKDGSTDYYNHSGLAMDDQSCFSCHGAAGDTTTSQFVHNVQVGTSGGRNCTSCHDVNGDKKKVNFTSMNKSMHGKLNSGATSTAQNASNKPCWGCHGTRNGTWANETDQPLDNHNTTVYKAPRKCQDCHITGSLQFTTKNVTDHIPSGYTSSTDVNTSSYNYAYCANCHNNSIGASSDPDGLGLSTGGSPANASVSHYGANRTAGKLMNATRNSTDCNYCHRNSSSMASWGIQQGSLANISNKNASGGGTDHSTYTSSGDCSQCHGGYAVTAGFTFHSAALGNGSGGGSGPNCKTCHDIGGSQTGKLVNFSAMNETNAIHKNLNSGAVTALDAENKKCWACHGDGSEPPVHPSNYKTPYNCTDCHNASGSQNGKYPGWNVTEHVKAGTVSGTEILTPLAQDCYACHNRSEMMLYANDPDSGTGAVYSGANGGNNSTSHYGLKRSLGSGDTYCNYCHSNASSIFYLSSHNKSIFEHTTNTSADVKNTTLTCSNSICHSSGRIHNASLAKPVQVNWTQGQKDYCAPCHNSTGSANKKVYNQRHNPANSSGDNITNCNYCHDSGSLGNTTLSYNLNVHSDNLTYPTNAINCTACHNASSTYVKSRKILTHFPNASKDKGNTSLSNRTCEACHGITAQSMHASGLVKKPAYTCADCHVSTSAVPYWANQSFNSYIDTTSHDNASTANATNCVWCHNNTNRVEPFHFTSYANGSAANPGWGGWQAGNLGNCTNCHDSAYSNQAPFYALGKPHAGTGNNTDECYGCHTSVNNYAAAPLAVHTVIQAPGNANCTKCHDTGGAASKEVDVAAMNKSDSIHLNLNSGASNSNATLPYAADSKRCWACHGDGSDKNEHDQARYKNPFKCEDCHTASGSWSGKYPSFNVTEHFAGGANIRAPGAVYCYDCHNKNEMLKQNNDAAISSSNASVGHYGKKRVLDGNDYPQQDTIAYCNKCHNNGSSVFPFIDPLNKTIANHSMNFNSTNPSCLDSSCHATGRIHNATLMMPELVLPNSTYCTTCHNNKEKHNSTGPNTGVNCTECHLNSSKSIHPARYLEYTSTWSAYNSSAVNCTSCHQGSGVSGFGKARIIPAPMNHSTYSWSGKLWGNYWNNNSQQDSCRYCHGNISYHNASGLGLVLSVKGNNTVRMNFSGVWCANCHYSKAPNYSAGAFTPAPPEVTTQTTPNDASVTWYNHSSDLASSYTDAKCKECHNNALDLNATSLNFTHNLAPGGGGPDCIACHDTGKGNAMVNVNAIKASMHLNLKNASASDTTGNPANRICWACHQSDGTQPQGHPDRKTNPYNCTDCHKNASRPGYVSGALQVANHYKSGSNITALVTSSTNDTSCTDCHLLSEMAVSYTEPDAKWNNNSLASHYGKNRSDVVAMDNNSYCNYCHNNESTAFAFNKSHNKAIFEHTINSTADIRNTTTLDCIDCHTTNPQSYRIHNSTLKTPSANAWTAGKEDRCAPCHKSTGSGSSLKVNNSYHNTTGSITDCGYCHNTDAIKAGNAPQNIHLDNLTKGGNSTFNNCYNCHQNGFASKVIKEHTNSSTGANITNMSMACDKSGCHNSSKTHSNALVKPVPIIWTAGGSDYCAPCHNSSDSTTNATKKIYNKGHDPANRTDDNLTSCGNCHNASTLGGIPSSFRLHDLSLTNLSGSNDLTCEGCHNATTTYVGNAKQILSHMPSASQYRGNTSMSGYTCKSCHNMTNKPSMHSAGMNRSNGTCETCHLNNTSPFKSSTKNLTQLAGMLNHSYNGSANTTCKMCHNASGRAKFHLSKYAYGDVADPQNSSGYSTFEPRGELLVNCRDCHETYNDTEPFNAPYFEANRTGVNLQEHKGKGYTLNNCYVCHTYEDNVSKVVTLHNVSIEPLSGGPNCKNCHDIASPNKTGDSKMWVNFTAFNSTISKHRNLSNATAWNGSALFTLINTACWACHQSDGKQMERHPDLKDDTTSTGGYKAYRCADCHTVGGIVSSKQPKIYQNATKVYRHYPGAVFSGNKVFTSAINCSMCHKNSKVAEINLSGYSDNIDAMAANISHYATRTDLINTRNSTSTYGCTECHEDGLPRTNYGNAALIINPNHNLMGSSPARCQKSCHNSDPGFNVTLHSANMGIYIGTSGCYSSGCHTAPGSGGRRKR